MASAEGGRARPQLPDLDALLDDVDAGRGARDTVVIPVPTVSARAVPEVRSTVREVVERALRPADPHERTRSVTGISLGAPPGTSTGVSAAATATIRCHDRLET